MKYPRIRKHLVTVPVDKGILIGSCENTNIEIEDTEGLFTSILFYCDGTNDLASIHSNLKSEGYDISSEELMNIIQQFSEVEYIMEDAANDLEIENKERQSRNLNFLSNFDAKGDKKYEYLQNIVDSTVMIIGLGGAGTNLIYNLASFGVKKIIGIDYDEVEISNLNRQILYKEADVGMKKVSAAQRALSEFNSSIEFIGIDKKVNSSSEIESMLEQYECDYLLCAADQPSLKILQWCNTACMKTGTIWSYSNMVEYVSRFQTIIPGITSCYECLEQEIFQFEEAKEKYIQLLSGKYGAQNDCILANSSLLASMLTFDLIKLLAGINHSNIASLNHIVQIDHFTNDVTHQEVSRHQNCSCWSKKESLIC